MIKNLLSASYLQREKVNSNQVLTLAFSVALLFQIKLLNK